MDAFYFTQQITALSSVNLVIVFRNEKSLDGDKIKYVTSNKYWVGKTKIVIRLFQVLLFKMYKPNIIIGIYAVARWAFCQLLLE